MVVTVRYFAAAAEASGREEERIDVQEDATLADLAALLEQRYGDPMVRVLRSGSFLMDRVVHRDRAHRLAGTVDVLPPFAGG